MDAAGNASAPSTALSVTIDTTAPATPAAPDLLASAIGGSNTDNITNVTTPTFSFSATPYFQFYRNGTLISGTYQTGSAFTTPTQGNGTFSWRGPGR